MNLRQMLERDEGRRYVAYPDPLTGGAPWTLGAGHTGPEVHQGLIWTDAQIDDALDADIMKATAGCIGQFSPWFQLLTEPRQAVLIAMAFQMGLSGLLKFKQTLAAVRDEHYELAADQMRQSVWYQQTRKRAERMAQQMASGVWS